MICPKCGAELPENAQICYKCGAEFEKINNNIQESKLTICQQNKSKTKDIIITIVITIIIVIGVIFLSENLNNSNNTNSNTIEYTTTTNTSKPNSYVLSAQNFDTVPCATNKSNFDLYINYALENTTSANNNITNMYNKGSIIDIERGTKCEITDSDFSAYEVKILEGSQKGLKVWTISDWVISENNIKPETSVKNTTTTKSYTSSYALSVNSDGYDWINASYDEKIDFCQQNIIAWYDMGYDISGIDEYWLYDALTAFYEDDTYLDMNIVDASSGIAVIGGITN